MQARRRSAKSSMLIFSSILGSHLTEPCPSSADKPKQHIRPPYAPIIPKSHDPKSVQLHESSLKQLLSPIVHLTTIYFPLFSLSLPLFSSSCLYKKIGEENEEWKIVALAGKREKEKKRKKIKKKEKERKEAALIAGSLKLHDKSARGTVGCASVRACRV